MINVEFNGEAGGTENVDIQLEKMLHGCVNILMNVKFVQADAVTLKKYHVLEETDLLVLVIVDQI